MTLDCVANDGNTFYLFGSTTSASLTGDASNPHSLVVALDYDDVEVIESYLFTDTYFTHFHKCAVDDTYQVAAQQFPVYFMVCSSLGTSGSSEPYKTYQIDNSSGLDATSSANIMLHNSELYYQAVYYDSANGYDIIMLGILDLVTRTTLNLAVWHPSPTFCCISKTEMQGMGFATTSWGDVSRTDFI